MSIFVFILSLVAMAVVVRLNRKRVRRPLIWAIAAGVGHAALWTAYSFVAIGEDAKIGYMFEVVIFSLTGVLSLIVASLAIWVPDGAQTLSK